MHVLTVQANGLPTAVITGPILIDESAAFEGVWSSNWDGSLSTDDTGIYLYEWDFGDGSTVQVGQVTAHDFTNRGVYEVRLTVTDNGDQDRYHHADRAGGGERLARSRHCRNPAYRGGNAAVPFERRGLDR